MAGAVMETAEVTEAIRRVADAEILPRFRALADHEIIEKRLADIFIIELNERITGAISEKKRYGWIAYFSQISDLTLLHKLDSMVVSLFARLPDFDRKPPNSLKTFARSYYEMKFNPSGGYVKNYDVISTRTEKLSFLRVPEDAVSRAISGAYRLASALCSFRIASKTRP